MSLIKAKDVTIGMQIVLDMGYGPHSIDEICTVVSVKQGKNLFNDDVVQIKAQLHTGEVVNVCDFHPYDKLETFK
jgi:hypothetical protein